MIIEWLILPAVKITIAIILLGFMDNSINIAGTEQGVSKISPVALPKATNIQSSTREFDYCVYLYNSMNSHRDYFVDNCDEELIHKYILSIKNWTYEKQNSKLQMRDYE